MNNKNKDIIQENNLLNQEISNNLSKIQSDFILDDDDIDCANLHLLKDDLDIIADCEDIENRKEMTVAMKDKGQRLDVFVCENTELTRSSIRNLIEQGEITVNGQVKKSGYALRLNDNVVLVEPKPKTLDLTPANIPIEIVYEDDYIIVVNKAQGMVVHPAVGAYSDTLVNALLYHCKNLSAINGVIRPGIVHRLDKNTSGLLVVAKNDKAHIDLQRQIANKSAKRHYLALVDGVIKKDEGIIHTYICRSQKDRKLMCVPREDEGRVAITHWKMLKQYVGYTLVEYELKTGRTHQIRVHSKHMGHCIVGDDVYGGSNKFHLNGQLLHAFRLELTHPITGERMIFTSNLPDYFEETLSKLVPCNQ